MSRPGLCEGAAGRPHRRVPDAFDSLILKDPLQEAALLSAFKALECEILVSEDPYICGETITKLRFAAGTLQDAAKGAIGHIDAAIKGKLADDESLRSVANAGMFMGYAGSLRRLLETLFAMGYKATDRSEQGGAGGPSIKVDVDHAIFHNMNQTRAGSGGSAVRAQRGGAIATASNDSTPPPWAFFACSLACSRRFRRLGCPRATRCALSRARLRHGRKVRRRHEARSFFLRSERRGADRAARAVEVRTPGFPRAPAPGRERGDSGQND